MQNRMFSIIMGVTAILALASLLAACAKQSPSTPPPTPKSTPASTSISTSTPPPKSAPTPAATTPTSTPLVLRYTTHNPPTGLKSEAEKWFAAQVEERTGGRVKVQIFWSEGLAKEAAALDAVGTGLADAGTLSVSANVKLRLFLVAGLPGLTGDPMAGVKGWEKTMVTDPALSGELVKSNQEYLWTSTTGNYGIFSKVPIRTLADLKGKKLGAAGVYGKLAAKLGANVVSVASPEIYEALQKGVIDGRVFTLEGGDRFKLQEVVRYFTNYAMGVYPAGNITTINLKRMNALPPDIRKVIREVSYDTSLWLAKQMIDFEAGLAKKFQAAGMEIIQPPGEESKIIAAASNEVHQEWVKELEAAGFPAGNTLKVLKDSIAQAAK